MFLVVSPDRMEEAKAAWRTAGEWRSPARWEAIVCDPLSPSGTWREAEGSRADALRYYEQTRVAVFGMRSTRRKA